MRLIASTVFLLMMSTQAFAVVDMKNANYADTWVDLQLSGSGFDLKVQRTYSSRSLFDGKFGFGWCTSFETNIKITADKNLKLTECGGGLELVYYPKQFKAADINVSVSQIIDAMKKQRNLSATAVQDLSSQLKAKSELRDQMAAELGIKPTIKNGTTFFANGREVEKIVFKDNAYLRSMPDGTSQRFDAQGRLTHIFDKNSNYLKLSYTKDNLTEIVDNNGRKLGFKYHPNNKVKTIVAPNGVEVNYQYKVDDLVFVQNGWGNKYNFEYDDLHNLTKIAFPDKTSKVLTYDKDKDWVMSFKDRDNCLETYKYDLSKDDPKNHYTSTVVKKCGDKTTAQNRYEFWHKVRAETGEKFLQRVYSKTMKEELDVTYHEVFGKPLTIRRNGDTTHFTYLANGLVKTKAIADRVLEFKYNDANRVAQVVLTQEGKKAKKILRTTNFGYDRKGNLVTAKNTDGQAVNLEYDEKGRIAKITDQAKKIVKIKYDERISKPSVIERPGVGSIEVSYNADGEVKVNNNKDLSPLVASQIASTFNNLLDVIAPATSELNL